MVDVTGRKECQAQLLSISIFKSFSLTSGATWRNHEFHPREKNLYPTVIPICKKPENRNRKISSNQISLNKMFNLQRTVEQKHSKPLKWNQFPSMSVKKSHKIESKDSSITLGFQTPCNWLTSHTRYSFFRKRVLFSFLKRRKFITFGIENNILLARLPRSLASSLFNFNYLEICQKIIGNIEMSGFRRFLLLHHLLFTFFCIFFFTFSIFIVFFCGTRTKRRKTFWSFCMANSQDDGVVVSSLCLVL